MRHKYYFHCKELFYRHEETWGHRDDVEHRCVDIYDMFTLLLEEINELRQRVEMLEKEKT